MTRIKTRYFSVDPERVPADVARELADLLHAGGIIAFATETVYGLGVLEERADTVERLFELKGRPASLRLTLHVADTRTAVQRLPDVPPYARTLMDRYWPGPLTLILPDGQTGPDQQRGTIGIRVPSHEPAKQFLRQVGSPVLATSANPHGESPAVDAQSVRAYFDGRIEAILDSGRTPLELSSTVVQVEGNSYRMLREGFITHEMVHQLLVGKNILFVCTGNSCRSPMAEGIFSSVLADKLGSNVDDLPEIGYTIHSAGVFAAPGGAASDNARIVMEERGMDVSRHRSRPVTSEMIDAADHIYALEASHLHQIVQFDGNAAERTTMLCEDGVRDPIGGGLDAYRQCADEIEVNIRRLLENF